MKKFLATLLATIMLASLFACESNAESTPSDDDYTISQSENNEKEDQGTDDTNKNNTSTPSKDKVNNENKPFGDGQNDAADKAEKQDTIDALKDVVSKDVEDTIDTLYAEYESLVADIDTYDKYFDNVERVEAFYEKVYEDTRQLCNRMYDYSINYAELILESDQPNRDKYDDLKIIYDKIYDDAGDDIYDEIYNGILDDIYDDFYDGILDDAYDYIAYREWSDAHSNEYDWWSDTRSDVYRKWSDFRSDVYGFWSDMRSALYSGDVEKAEEEIIDFQEDIDKIRARGR